MEKSPNRTEGSSKATRLGVVHCGSRVGGLRSDRQVGKSTRRGRGELAREFSDDGQPQERHGGKLRAVQADHDSETRIRIRTCSIA